MLGTRSLDNPFKSNGQGAAYHYQTQSEEDDIFYQGAKNTQWKQKIIKFSPHFPATFVHTTNNGRLGTSMSTTLTKAPDGITGGIVLSGWCGLLPDGKRGVHKTSWVNGRALYVNKESSHKVAQQVIFSTNGISQMVILELSGLLQYFAKSVGLFQTEEALLENSQFPTILMAPFIGMPYQNDPEKMYPQGLIQFHQCSYEQTNRPIHEMILSYGDCEWRPQIGSDLPLELGTRMPVGNNSAEFQVAASYVWLSDDERESLAASYWECIYKEFKEIGSEIDPPNSTTHKVSINLEVEGPCAFIGFYVQSQEDVDCGNWTKLCDDYGQDYIESAMLFTGGNPRDDGLPVQWYREGMIINHFKVKPNRHFYVLQSAQTDNTSRNPTGSQNFTNIDKKRIDVYLKPHPRSTLKLTAVAGIYNGTFMLKGAGGKIWQ